MSTTAHGRALVRGAAAAGLTLAMLAASGCGSASPQAAGSPASATQTYRPFSCPAQERVDIATGLPLHTITTPASCGWQTAGGTALGTGVTIMDPAPQDVGTLDGIRGRFAAENDPVVDRPDFGAGAFEVTLHPPAGVFTSVCILFVTASDGKPTQVEANYARGPATDLCRYAEEVGQLVR